MCKTKWVEVGYGLIYKGSYADTVMYPGNEQDVIDPVAVRTWQVVGQCAEGHPLYQSPEYPDVAIDLGCDSAWEAEKAACISCGNPCDDEMCHACMRNACLQDPDYLATFYLTAYCLLEMWDAPASVQRLSTATLALRRALRHRSAGQRTPLDVMENPRVLESMEMLAGVR